MINKDTNTQCRWTSTFFLLTLYSSLKNFLSGTSNAIFFTSYFFNAFFWRKWTFWGAPCRQDEHPDASFVKMQRFFLSLWHFSLTEVRGQYFWLKPPFKEFRTRLEEQEFTGKIQGHSIIFGLYVSDFWMSSCREPTCPLFWLEQELHVEGEQVKYFKVHFSFVVFRSNARSHSRHPFDDHSDGRRVAKMSCDSKCIVKEGLNS